jgi:predicted nuclease of restriction endonuclease-like (RecB) superfamily
MTNLPSSPTYIQLLTDVKEKIRQAQVKAVIAVNQEMLFLYWEIGNAILAKQEKEGWGAKVADQLSLDLKKEFPGMKGFSRRNLLYMRQFAATYPDFTIVQPLVAQISWSHNVLLLDKCQSNEERIWYAHKAVQFGWSKRVMVHQIETRLYERQGKAISNFSTTLPKPDSDLAQQALKDPYIFDFLTLSKKAKEKDLEVQLIRHITSFLLELGAGFAFAGSQYLLPIEGEDYRIDLLFYHLKLRRYVAIDLKIRKFKPDDAGKMNFYLSALDDLVKDETDHSSIGIILCKDKKNVLVEYALKDLSKPIGVSVYRLTDAIPKELRSSLPSIEDLERELKELDDDED